MRLQKVIFIGAMSLGFVGCNSTGQIKSESYTGYQSPQEVIAKKQINESDDRSRAYVYDWGKNSNVEPQSLYPRKHLNGYCQSQGGRFTLLHRSQMSQVKDAAQRKRLSANSHIKQGIGAYQCIEKDGQRWIVSIEPTAERRDGENRVVLLQSKIMSQSEAERFYRQQATPEKTTAKVSNDRNTKNNKDKDDEKVVVAAPLVSEAAATATIKETPQQQQSRLYVNARRDINAGKNLNNACNSAQRAYNYGKLQGTEGTRIYTESGMLVARCLTSIPAYSNRFPNAKVQATRILQNLSKNYNHAGAKNMLNQMK